MDEATRRSALTMGAAALLAPGAAVAAEPVAQARLAGFLAAFNSGDERALTGFLGQWFPGEPPAAWAARQRETGGFDLLRLEAGGAARAVAVGHDRDADRFARLTLEAGADGRIVTLDHAFIPRPPYAPPPDRLTAPALGPAIAARMQRLAANDRLSGAVLAVAGGRTVLRRAYGLADRAEGIANTPATRFRMGSMNKMLTGVAAIQLVQAGKLDLKTPVGAWLPDYPSRAFREQVTLAQLLTHTAGAGDIFGPQFQAHRQTLKTVADYVALYGARDPAYAPGDHFEYANYGFVVAGRIIEAASGLDYDTYVERHILRPAGMTATGTLPEDVAVPGRAVGYMAGPEGLVSNTDTLPYRGGPAGGGYSTVDDMAAFARALLGRRLLDEAHTRLMLQGHVQPGPDPANLYGYGMEVSVRGGKPMAGHGGGAPGMNGQLWMWPDTGNLAVVLTNHDPPWAALSGAFIALRMPLA